MSKRVMLVALTVLWLTGCNTVAGFGKDLGRAGDAITGASDKARK
ncbi:MAG: entericidin A/B family lipoprotein [Burkholderiaceae bacterium]